MNNSYIAKDIRAILRGLELVSSSFIRQQQNQFQHVWQLSSVRTILENSAVSVRETIKNANKDDLSKSIKETLERSSMVYHGIKQFAVTAAPISAKDQPQPEALKNIPKGITVEDLTISELRQEDKELIQRLEKEFELKLEREKAKLKKESESLPVPDTTKPETVLKANESKQIDETIVKESPEPTVSNVYISKQTLNPKARQRKVPSSRLARFVSFGSLAAGLGVGTVAEVTRRTLGINNDAGVNSLDRVFLSEANAERIVQTLCKVRGAALKIGQILSIQDNNVISPGLQKAFERVRQSADFMPSWQVHKMLARELGEDWRSKVSCFEEKPFAAASIGQVHHVTLLDGREAAMKIQYPGVAEGIESDINNLVGILKIWNVFPQGMFIDNLVEVAKRELSWEVDYEREKVCTKEFDELLKPYPDYIVPEVIDDLSTKYIFTTILIDGIPVDQGVDLDEQSRHHMASLLMNLCLHELFDFRYMQTDPNWSNFFYNPDTRKLALLDFGATRSYSKEFMDKYIEVIKGAADRDRDKVLNLSREMGFLTGYESKAMENAHVDAVMILGEVFASDEPFDFGKQDTTKRITQLVPTIIQDRLCPPPEEIYSLHRKLSGVFLLCAKLNIKMSCRSMFRNVYSKYKKTQ